MKQLTLAELLEMFDESVRADIGVRLAQTSVTGIVVFENQQMDSSCLGDRTAMIVGPNCTCKTVEECEGKWLNDLPSQRQYAVAFYKKGV
jgi:hypothetical protein